MYNYMLLTNLATSMPAIVAQSVIASRNSDPPSENLTNTALPTCLFLTVSIQVGAVLCRSLVDDGSFHEACEKLQQAEVPYFHQFSTAKLPKDRTSSTSSSDLSPAPSPPRCDSRTSATQDIPAVSLTFFFQLINPFK